MVANRKKGLHLGRKRLAKRLPLNSFEFLDDMFEQVNTLGEFAQRARSSSRSRSRRRRPSHTNTHGPIRKNPIAPMARASSNAHGSRNSDLGSPGFYQQIGPMQMFWELPHRLFDFA